MKTTLRQYADSIEGKAVMVFCIDCCAMSEVIDRTHLISCTSIGTMVSSGKQRYLEYLSHYLEQEEYSTVVLVGHSRCLVVNHLRQPGYLNTKLENESRYMRMLEEFVRYRLNCPENSISRMLVHLHIAFQMRKLLEMDFIKRRVDSNSLQLKGIYVNDDDDGEVEDVDEEIYEQLLMTLN